VKKNLVVEVGETLPGGPGEYKSHAWHCIERRKKQSRQTPKAAPRSLCGRSGLDIIASGSVAKEGQSIREKNLFADANSKGHRQATHISLV
jgi:hypothetical protein